MAKLSDILRSVENGGLSFYCPGCRERHVVWTGPGSGPRWDWNGDTVKPTFYPSILVRSVQTVRDDAGRWTGDFVLDGQGNPVPAVCHSFVQGGNIKFLGDCTHSLANQIVPLPEPPRGEE